MNIETGTELCSPDQEWFWTEQWQTREREVDENIAAGRVARFGSTDAFLNHLESLSDNYCPHHEAGECGSCPWFSVPYQEQLSRKFDGVRAVLGRVISDGVWLEPVASPAIGIRNKAKMAVTGTVDNPRLGLTTGVDLCDCPIYVPAFRAAFPAIKQFITMAQLQPYDLTSSHEKITPAKARSRGELKLVILTASALNELMITFVLRSTADLARIKSKLPWLLTQLPNAKVVSVNIHPAHKATILGDRDIYLTEQTVLPMPVGDVELLLGPTSFFQTNTFIAGQLYQTAAQWVDELFPSVEERQGGVSKPRAVIWDLYCGVGGFALSLAAHGRSITGIEVSTEAIQNAKAAASYLNLRDSALPLRGPQNDGVGDSATSLRCAYRGEERVEFIAGDATEFALTGQQPKPDLVVVNPPRRGIGIVLSEWINNSDIPYVLYSSCNPNTLAQDLATLTNYRTIRAKLFDMFPNTTHSEVLILLEQTSI